MFLPFLTKFSLLKSNQVRSSSSITILSFDHLLSAHQDSTPSPLDKFKDNKTTVDETALLLHNQIGRRNDELRVLEREIRQLEDRLNYNELR